ncbi:alpha-amylase family glycosyl hydrolase [Aphanothece sacrum]|uniref:Alpha amylase catalytic region n=1 Tax=Aphanothece sacrum FPU1 TaxID=1920663 RepID=A0A401IJS5_APHSA|nr:alpha-amylase family glycosyl hydrolase [Aphanothece sacrum]GBF81361.1 alpha amylase catalytic region [Aphanothece sacrum FPU1]GBF86118.1 alpha amylase catalytic domain protein [Aphanothece sacrum FPU3]
MSQNLAPSLYQINTRVWLNQLSHQLGRHATLDDIPDTELDKLANLGFNWVYFLSVWQTGEVARQVSRTNPQWLAEYRELLPDLKEEDISGSGFAITSYTLNTSLGESDSLIRLRDRLHQRGLKLMLDFVPNHTAPDHHWTKSHPDYYISGNETLLAQQPQNYIKIDSAEGSRILAYGRDPYFDGWPDTLQLNYGNLELQTALINELLTIAQWCDGLRCDMAMLVLPEIFERTWGIPTEPFWPKAIPQIRQQHPDFVFMAEVYWDMEWTLQQQGFDYTYDKKLYDRLEHQIARPVREHFWADLDYQSKSARFLENHDEPRAAATFAPDVHQAAAILSFFCPGLRFFHQGQLQGWTKKISVHLGRGPQQPTDTGLEKFYGQLLEGLRLNAVREGKWQLLECKPAWGDNWTWDCFIAFAWQGNEGERVIVVVNYAGNQSQCYIPLPWSNLAGQRFKLQDIMGGTSYEVDGDNLVTPGLYLDFSAWGYQVLKF